MNEVTPFVFEDKHLVRSILLNDEPWFVGKDVCNVLEQGNPRQVIGRLDNDEKGVQIVDTPGGPQEMTVINESGLYSLILTSRKPSARRFKKWVTSEVLPSLRRTGAYRMPNKPPETFEDRPELPVLLSLVRECRSTWGRTAAQRLWRQLPLPQPDRPGLAGGLTPEQQWWLERLREGAPIPSGGGWPETIRCDVLTGAWCASHGGGDFRKLAAGFGRALHVMVPGLGRKRASGEGRSRPWFYVLPPLDECRVAFERLTGQKP